MLPHSLLTLSNMHKIHVKIFVAPEAKVCKLFPGAESFEIEVGRI